MPLLIQAIARVSTHSRLKAAGMPLIAGLIPLLGFNTQPPEGGWSNSNKTDASNSNVSTHSRLKAAGVVSDLAKKVKKVSTHSRLKAAGRL